MKLFLAALFTLLLFSIPVLADAVAPAAASVTSVVTTPGGAAGGTTTITTAAPAIVIPWGMWLTAIVDQIVLPLLSVVILSVIAWAARFLPASLRAFVNAKNATAIEQLLTPAISTGLKQLEAQATGQTLSVAAGSAVVATATQYAIDHGPAYLIKWAGGADGIQQKIIARLPVVTAPLPPASALPSVAISPKV